MSYIGGWLKALKNDQKLIVFAAAQAGKAAAEYIFGPHANGDSSTEENEEVAA
ncbi:MAG: hypothetical protein Q8S19_01270 [Bacillota bacterium]|nr:hypothetical protein [Bacillota bacterium]